MNVKLSKNFILQEFVSKTFWEKWGERSIWFIDQRIVESVQTLRDELGVPLTINNWFYGGSRQASGLRVEGMLEWLAYSQHSFGRAVDVVSSSITADDMRQFLYSNKNKFPHITAIETNVSWLHIDCRETKMNDYLLFNPS